MGIGFPLNSNYGRMGDKAISLLGDDLIAERRNEISLDFSKTIPTSSTLLPAPQSLMTTTAVNGGTLSQAAGLATFATNVTAGAASFKAISTDILPYVPGGENFYFFSASFTAGAANSFQRIGVISSGETDGFWLGYENANVGITVLKGGSQGTLISTFNADPLDGSLRSLFKRGGLPEAINWQNLNLFAIKWSSFGNAPIQFFVMSPDGQWILFHAIPYPNLTAATSTNKYDFSAYVNVSRTTGTTNFSLSSGCIASGTSAGEFRGIRVSKYISAATTNATSVTASPTRLKAFYLSNTNAAARFFKIYDKSTAPTVGTDVPVMTIAIPGAAAGAVVSQNLVEGVKLNQGLAFAITAVGTDADATIIGANDVIANLEYIY